LVVTEDCDRKGGPKNAGLVGTVGDDGLGIGGGEVEGVGVGTGSLDLHLIDELAFCGVQFPGPGEGIGGRPERAGEQKGDRELTKGSQGHGVLRR
jgi:hypothetical protein